MPRAVVIGGGILGLLSASSLARRGFDVTMLEAADRLGGLSRGLELGGVELDIGVRILPAGNLDCTDLIVSSCGGIHRFLPMAERARFRHSVQTPPGALVQMLPLMRRLEVLFRRLATPDAAGTSLRELAEWRLTRPVWRGLLEPLAKRVLGENAPSLSGDENRSFGLFGNHLARGLRSAPRGIKDVLVPFLRGGLVKEGNLSLGSPASWPRPDTRCADLPRGTGLYPSNGPFQRFVDALAADVGNRPACDVRVSQRVTGFWIADGRIRAVKTAGGDVVGDEFIVSAATDQLFAEFGMSIPPLSFRTLVQTTLLLDAPPPDYLYEIVYDPSPCARIFFPQRFQGLDAANGGLFAAESWCAVGEESAMCGADADSRAAWARRVHASMIELGTAPRGSTLLDHRVDVVPRALMVFPGGWFRALRSAVEDVQSRCANVSFTGMASTFAPITPAATAIGNIASMTRAIAERVGGGRPSSSA